MDTDTSRTGAEGAALTAHAAMRMAERRIAGPDVVLALRFGKPIWHAGMRHYFPGRRSIPETVGPDLAKRAEGTVVAKNGAICTVYRDREYPRRERRSLPRRGRSQRGKGNLLQKAEMSARRQACSATSTT